MPYAGRRLGGHERSLSTSETSSAVNSFIVQIDTAEETSVRQQALASSSSSLSTFNIERRNETSRPGSSRASRAEGLRSSPSEILPYHESSATLTRADETLSRKTNSERFLTRSICSNINSDDSTSSKDKAIRTGTLTVQEIMDMEHSSDNNDQKCRYCFGAANGWVVKEPLVSPCRCSGSMAYVHKSCLERWLSVRDANECDLCRFMFKTDFVYKPIKEVSNYFVSQRLFAAFPILKNYETFRFLGSIVRQHSPSNQNLFSRRR